MKAEKEENMFEIIEQANTSSSIVTVLMPYFKNIDKGVFGAFVCTLVQNYCRENSINEAEFMKQLAEVADKVRAEHEAEEEPEGDEDE